MNVTQVVLGFLNNNAFLDVTEARKVSLLYFQQGCWQLRTFE